MEKKSSEVDSEAATKTGGSRIDFLEISEESMRVRARVIADFFRATRKALELSQQEVADLMGVHHSRVAYLEKGEAMPTIPTIMLLCHIYKINPMDVFKLCVANIDLSQFNPTPEKMLKVAKELKLAKELRPKGENKMYKDSNNSVNLKYPVRKRIQ
ncbi:helix-turn-helix transcriptional regulator [Spirosoma sp. BT702]|uniref:Helix-turn-helix transcriptional regulator n=1 Tax=Spirosoma profusum TaxID=2771354 RepID=A0A927AUK4_9BACT|nr:helix-turn-helix transcriptional regulator [Spirosoma profusum]MBD2704690.1 helix-turn-helix transcriptional regulator [Spirosoma profusum]